MKKKLFQGDLSRRGLVLAGLAVLAVKLALTSMQLVLATPDAAPLDDTLMYEAARSVAAGEWLGEYNWLTLGKYMFFPVWLAALHTLHIPYLLGGQLLQAAAALAGAWAFAPVLRSNRWRLFVFSLLLFNPAASAAEVQLRIYRDNITPALTLLFVAGFVGAALRLDRPVRNSVGFLLAGGAGLAAAWLNREDSLWLLPFAAAASVITLLFILFRRDVAAKVRRALALALPYGVLAAGVLAFCAMNYQYYGRFIISDFTSREFKDAYGAMTRVVSEAPRDKVPVPRDVRLKLYETVPAFAELEPYLETDVYYNEYGTGDISEKEFGGGGFYWALRRAASEAGYYETANTAREYFETLAQQINAVCDSGVLAAGPRRSATTPRIEAKYILPTLREGIVNLGRALVFSEASPVYRDIMSVQLFGQPELRAEYESFLGNGVNWQAQAGTELPYYSRVQEIAYFLLDAVRLLYAALLPAGFAAALVWQVKTGRGVLRAAREKKAHPALMLWLIGLGLLLSVLLRCFMIGFMFAASFNNVQRIMYLCGVHPMLLLYAALGLAGLWNARAPRAGTGGGDHG